ncbi:hypothetical protein LINGRAHAP2_LOCUS8201 [Linum grandiflorum]
MKKPEASSRSSSRTSFAMLLPTLSMLGGRPSLPWMSSTL